MNTTHAHCDDCAPEFTECWNDASKCRKRPSSLAQASGSETSRADELAIHELERSRWAIERKEWILARVYASHALQWIKAAERDEDTTPNAKVSDSRE